MDNVMQFLFNTNHEQPSIPVWILLIVIAVNDSQLRQISDGAEALQ